METLNFEEQCQNAITLQCAEKLKQLRLKTTDDSILLTCFCENPQLSENVQTALNICIPSQCILPLFFHTSFNYG